MLKKVMIGMAVLGAVVWQGSLQAQADEMTATTSTGAVFTRITDRPGFENAWRDPSGMIWSNTVENAYGSPLSMNLYQAQEYCQNIGADLPSREDVIRLREYMGAQPGSPRGYRAQILYGLYDGAFWVSRVHPDVSFYAYIFHGDRGVIGGVNRVYFDFSVWCVVR